MVRSDLSVSRPVTRKNAAASALARQLELHTALLDPTQYVTQALLLFPKQCEVQATLLFPWQYVRHVTALLLLQ